MNKMQEYKRDPALLWNDFREGNETAFTILFDLYSDSLFRYGIKFVIDDDLVKDCIQDLFIKLHKNHANLAPTNNPLLYLFKALKNSILDALEAKDNRITYFPQDELPFWVDYKLNNQLEDNENDEEIKELFNKVINMLTPRQKEAIYLHYQSELSYEEIAQLLDINCQSVRNLVHRAVEKIRAEMNFNIFCLCIF